MLCWHKAPPFSVKVSAPPAPTPLEIPVCLWATLKFITTVVDRAQQVGHRAKSIASADHSDSQLTSLIRKTTVSTRSRIGLQLEDGSILSCYHHWDGYPGGLGAKLLAEYTSKEKVASLIDGGDISTIMSRRTWDGVGVDGEIVLYYAERGDTGVEPILADDDWEYIRQTADCGGEYAYFFNPETNKWSCFDRHTDTYIDLYKNASAKTPLAV
jgi:hypothetical protein